MTRLTIYGDFNCPFSALASARADVLLAAETHEIEWRAIQHDTSIPAAGDPVDDKTAAMLKAEVATIRELSDRDLRLDLVVPPVRSNTALASAAFAAECDDPNGLRQRLFAAVWVEGRNLGNHADLELLGAAGHDDAMARRWQRGVRRAPPAHHPDPGAALRVRVSRARAHLPASPSSPGQYRHLHQRAKTSERETPPDPRPGQ